MAAYDGQQVSEFAFHDPADGSVKEYLYHRVTGLPLDPDRLVESFTKTEKKKRRPGNKTVTDLIRFFDTSETFNGLSEDSRREYVWKLRRIEQKWGTVPEDTFNNQDDAEAFAADVLAWHQELGKKSRRSADNLISTVCRVLSFAKEKRRIKFQPIPSFERFYKSGRADKIWSDELQQSFIRTARLAMATAIYLVRNTAMRASDVRKFPWNRYDGARVQIRSSKTGKLLWIPATRELKTYLDSLPRAGALVMLTPTGKAYTRRYFNEHWREDADAVNAGDLNFHDNRGTTATLLAEAGTTAPEIAEALTWTVTRRSASSTPIWPAVAFWPRTLSRSLRTTGTRKPRPLNDRRISKARNDPLGGFQGVPRRRPDRFRLRRNAVHPRRHSTI